MTNASLASFFVLAAAACGTTASRPPVAPGNTAPDVSGPACDVSGPELFAARTSPRPGYNLLVDGKPMGDRATILYQSGGWMVTGTDQPSTGCLTPADLERAEGLLADLPLAVRYPAPDEPRCMAEAMTSTTYSLRGADVYTYVLCSGASLDARSQRAFNDVEQLVAAAAAATAKPAP